MMAVKALQPQHVLFALVSLLANARAFQRQTARRCVSPPVASSSPKLLPRLTSSALLVENKKYGRGAEIWPPTNEEPVLLSDSFPGGVVPSIALDALSLARREGDVDDGAVAASSSGGKAASDDLTPPIATSEAPLPRRGRKRKLIRGAVARVLRGAAASQQSSAVGDRSARGGEDAFWDAPVDRSPAVVALVLLGCRLVRPTDVMAVAALTAYLIVLGLTSSSPRESTTVGGGGSNDALLPSLPPRGHVPSLVSNPLGMSLTNSAAYRTWLRVGAVVGLLLPLGAVGWYGLGPRKDMVAAAAVARPVFLICCQAVSEATSRRLLAPLPLRILIPLAYSAIRLGPLWDWALCPTPLGYAGRILAATNYIYWATNLFGFLLPVAAVRYMRAHFFCVEASEVTLREGGETSAGLIP